MKTLIAWYLWLAFVTFATVYAVGGTYLYFTDPPVPTVLDRP